jgi:hypothetical protein
MPPEKSDILSMAISQQPFTNPIPNPIKIQRLFRKYKKRQEKLQLFDFQMAKSDTVMEAPKTYGDIAIDISKNDLNIANPLENIKIPISTVPNIKPIQRLFRKYKQRQEKLQRKELVKSLNADITTPEQKLNVLAMAASQSPFINPLEVKKELVKSLNADITTPEQKLNVLAMAASEQPFDNPIPNPIKIQRLFRKIKARRERRKLLSLVEPLDTDMPPEQKSDILAMAASQPSFDANKVFKEEIKANRKAKRDAIRKEKSITKSEDKLARETLRQLELERIEEKRIVEQEERLRIANEEYKVLREKQKQEKEELILKQQQEKLLIDTSSDKIKRAIERKALKEKGKKLLQELRIKHEKEKQKIDNAADVIKRVIEKKALKEKGRKQLNELRIKEEEKKLQLEEEKLKLIIKQQKEAIAIAGEKINNNIALKISRDKAKEQIKLLREQRKQEEELKKQEELKQQEELKKATSSDVIKKIFAKKVLKTKGKKQLEELKIKQAQEKEELRIKQEQEKLKQQEELLKLKSSDVVKDVLQKKALQNKIKSEIKALKLKQKQQQEELRIKQKQQTSANIIISFIKNKKRKIKAKKELQDYIEVKKELATKPAQSRKKATLEEEEIDFLSNIEKKLLQQKDSLKYPNKPVEPPSSSLDFLFTAKRKQYEKDLAEYEKKSSEIDKERAKIQYKINKYAKRRQEIQAKRQAEKDKEEQIKQAEKKEKYDNDFKKEFKRDVDNINDYLRDNEVKGVKKWYDYATELLEGYNYGGLLQAFKIVDNTDKLIYEKAEDYLQISVEKEKAKREAKQREREEAKQREKEQRIAKEREQYDNDFKENFKSDVERMDSNLRYHHSKVSDAIFWYNNATKALEEYKYGGLEEALKIVDNTDKLIYEKGKKKVKEREEAKQREREEAKQREEEERQREREYEQRYEEIEKIASKIKDYDEEISDLYLEYEREEIRDVMTASKRTKLYNSIVKVYNRYIDEKAKLNKSEYKTLFDINPEWEIFDRVKNDYLSKELKLIEKAKKKPKKEKTPSPPRAARNYSKEEIDAMSMAELRSFLADKGFLTDEGLRAPKKGVDSDDVRFAYNAYQRGEYKRAAKK